MEGMMILAEYCPYNWIRIAIVASATVLLVAVMVFNLVGPNWLGIGCAVTGVCAVIVLVAMLTFEAVVDGTVMVKATIDDSVSFNSVIEKYEPVKADGKIWTLKVKDAAA